ncbi:hypothetical protein N825_13890 [Skermanella stibiiresistens SB22]|uniref:Uncharacterized protein n=1 Tax=Skermanella stibiiresistens SB22 TaxID=1385369 RepID=W9GWL8_9PROT|nr:hypothetical protein [Skermanella stibiiresistens]EWY38295.1 hypothetical protein N825_13890 [Skermanella stibiiresistens SB22]
MHGLLRRCVDRLVPMITPPIPPTAPRRLEDLPILEMADALRKAREEILETFGDDLPEDVQERLMPSYLRAQGIVKKPAWAPCAQDPHGGKRLAAS